MEHVYVGVDWGTREHHVHVLEGPKPARWVVKHTASGLRELCERLLAYGADQVMVAVERPDGLLVEAMVQAGFRVFHVNPKQLDRFRDRFRMAAVKDDALDAQVLAHSLKTDGILFNEVPRLEAWEQELRALTRAEVVLGQQVKAQAARLAALVSGYFPQLLSVVKSFARTDWALDLLEACPSQAAAVTASDEDLSRILARTKLTVADVRHALADGTFHVAPGLAEAGPFQAELLIEQLRMLRRQQKAVNARMGAILKEQERVAAAAEPSRTCDIAVLRSQPGVGDKLLAGLLAEAPQLLRSRDYRRLRAVAGVAPTTRRTGRMRPTTAMRRACSAPLRRVMHLIAGGAVTSDPKFRALYVAARGRGHGHARALRTVADRLLAVMCACLRDGQPFDGERAAGRVST